MKISRVIKLVTVGLFITLIHLRHPKHWIDRVSSIITDWSYIHTIFSDEGSGFWPFNLSGDVVLDASVLNHIRANVLIPPANKNTPYSLEYPEVKDPSSNFYGFTSRWIVPELFPDIQSGVFFEAGALDGETSSNTLYLERELGWTGMLAEMTPINHQEIKNKNRKAFFAPVCLSPVPRPVQVNMLMAYNEGYLLSRWAATISKIQKRHIEKNEPDVRNMGNNRLYEATVDCYPLQSLLTAVNMTKVDYLSLDLEGVELKVLKTIHWDKIDVKVISVDIQHTEEGLCALEGYLMDHGFMKIFGDKDPVVFVNASWYGGDGN